MQQGNVSINTGPFGTNSNDYNQYNYGLSGASGTFYNQYNYGASGTNFGLSGASGTNFGASGASGTNYVPYINNFGPSGTHSNINVITGSSGTFMNDNSQESYHYNIINELAEKNIRIGIKDDDFNFQAENYNYLKRRYIFSYKGIEFDFIININELNDDNLICNGEFKKMLKYINIIICSSEDARIVTYLNRIIDNDFFIKKKIVKSIHITI